MNNLKFYIALFCIINGFLSNAQQFNSEEDRLKHANTLFEEKSFVEAEPHMLHFLSTKNNSEFNFKYGVCALFKYADKTKAIGYLRKALKDKNIDPQAYFYLARAQHFNYLFSDALTLYEKYQSLADPKQAQSLQLDMYMSMCQSGQSLMSNLSNLIVVDKTSTAEDKFQYSYNLDEIGGRILVADLFQSKLDQKKDYKSIIYFPPSGQDKLFFSSYGKDGKTGLDLYMVTRMSSGDWSEPIRLPESINTPYDDNFPYLHPDGKSFYFSSKGHNSMGGYDIFRCSYDYSSNNFGPVYNLDYKINSTDDDILYIVDDNNENAFFSSKRASDGGKIDVYNVKVQLLPIQNVIIAGEFKNLINDSDFKASIKVQNVANNKLIGVYTVNDDRNYTILLPSAGKYKFIVETPLSEKIHAGLVTVPPQDGLKALKQEIELVDKNGNETLVILNEFDQQVVDEAAILATVVKEMADPEVNFDKIPDSILNPVEIAEEKIDLDSNELDVSNVDDLIAQNQQNILKNKNEMDEIEMLSNKSKSIAEHKANEASKMARKADLLVQKANSTGNSVSKDSLFREAKINQEKSQALLNESEQSLHIAGRYDVALNEKKTEADKLSELNKELTNAKENGTDVTALTDLIDDLQNQEITTPIQRIQEEAKKKENEANGYLSEAESLRADQESMIYQIDKEKEALKFTKKKKDKVIIEENITDLEEKVKETELLVEEQFRLYENAELERKEFVNEADLMEAIQLSDEYNEIEVKENIDTEEVENLSNQINTDYLDKNEELLSTVALTSNEDVALGKTSDVSSNSNEETLVSDFVEEGNWEEYNEVSTALENTTTEVEDFEDVSQNLISYNNENSQQSSEMLEQNKEEIVDLKSEISALEGELKSTTNPNKIESINQQINQKSDELDRKENEVVRAYEDINKNEIEYNDEVFEKETAKLSEDAKSDEDYLSAVFYMESANKQKEKASSLRQKANDPRTSPDEKDDLLKQAHQFEMVAIDDQQTANNLLGDVQEKYPSESNSEVRETSTNSAVDQVVKEQEEATELIENSPITIPISTDPSKVQSQKINGESFDPNQEPQNFEVAVIADDNPMVNLSNISDPSGRSIVERNQKSIEKVDQLSIQQETLEMQKADLVNEKLVEKVDKKINKIEKKKAKSQLKMASDVAQVNQAEINKLNEEANASKQQASLLSSDNFNYNQAVAFQNSAEQLADEALKLREEANDEKDPVKKANLLEQATSSENTAIAYYQKSNKLYSEAIVENFSDDKLTLAKTVQGNNEKQSEQLDALSNASSNKAIDFRNKSTQLRNESENMSKKDREKALVQADQYDQLARKEQLKADDYASKAKKYKSLEEAMVKDISIAENIENEDISYVAGTEEFKSYNEKQKSLNKLEVEKSKKLNDQRAYQNMSRQLDAKADALDQQAKKEKNPIKKADLLSDRDEFRREAKKKKSLADALIISVDSLDGEIRIREDEQEIILSSLDSTSATQVRALAISGKAEELIDQIAEELPPNEVVEENQKMELNDTENETVVETSKIDEIVPAKGEITSNTYVPPSKVTSDIIAFTEEEVSVYSDDNPIPINPKLPDGLIYKVQVGAFRNPIPQDLFKGFAPISAEKVRDDITRYRVGYFTSYNVANSAKNQVRGLGYRDAFVVALNNGSRITLSEARAMESSINTIIPPDPIIQPTANNEDVSSNLTDENIASATAANTIEGVFFSVQVGAFSKPLTNDNELNVSPLVLNSYNGLYKYSTGIFNSIEDAGRKKASLIDQGIADAFIIAYNDGRSISLDQATSSNPDRIVEYQNPEFYYLDFGTYNDSTSNSIAQSFINLRDLNIRSRVRKDGKQFFSKKFNTRAEALEAQKTANSAGLVNVSVLKSNRDDFAFNYEFKVNLGSYQNDLPAEVSIAFENLKQLEIRSYKEGDEIIYLSKSRNSYEEAITDQNACRMENLTEARIVVFKDGVPTTLDKVLNSFK